MHWNKRKTPLIALIVLIYLVAAWNSHGYYHADEHYQIIRAALYKTGEIGWERLPWEFPSKIRPALQPALYYALLRWVPLDDPYTQAAISRVFTLMLFLFAMYLNLRRRNPNIPWLLVAAVMLTWFMPTLLCRFSAESWSGMFVLFGMALWPDRQRVPRHRMTMFWVGLTFGLAMTLRPQVAVLVLTFLVFEFIHGASLKRLYGLTLGGLLAVGLLVLADWWFYGKWLFTPGRYLVTNLFEDVAAVRFGSAPFGYYFQKGIEKSLILPGLLILGTLVLGFVKARKNVLVWMIAAFILAHSLLAHKEVRFLFPAFGMIILLMVDLGMRFRLLRRLTYGVTLLFLPVLLHVIWQPPSREISVLKYFHDHPQDGKVELGFIGENPYSPFGYATYYYRNHAVRPRAITNESKLEEFDFVYGDRKRVFERFDNEQFIAVWQHHPEWLIVHFDINQWSERSMMGGVYKVKPR